MSVYYFLSTSDKNFPDLLSPKKHRPDGSAMNVFSCEEDLYELEIIKEHTGGYRDIPFYTKLPFIYTIDWQFTKERCSRLFEHIKANAEGKNKYELHRIWLANCISKSSFRKDIQNGVDSVKKISLSLNTDRESAASILAEAFSGEDFLQITLY